MTTILAQMGNLMGTVSPLRSPPLVEHLLLETPWPLAIGLVGVGLALLWFLNRNGRGRAGLLALGASATLALVVVGLAALVTTDRERIGQQTRRLVGAAATLDQATLREVLDPRVVVPLPRLVGGNRVAGIENVLGLVDQYPGGQYPVGEHDIQGVQAQIDGASVGVTQVRVRVRLKSGGYEGPMGTWWRIDWQRESGGQWKATGVKLLFVDGIGMVD